MKLQQFLCAGRITVLESFSTMYREADGSVSQTNSPCNNFAMKEYKIAEIYACGQLTVLQSFTAILR